MLDAIAWYLVLQLVGLAALPVTARLLGRLPDRGYALARPLGLLLVGYLLWLGSIFGLLDNRPATSAVLLIGIGLAGWIGLGQARRSLARLWRERGSLVLTTELLFLAGFGLWCAVRAGIPDISGTEKPMEFAFLNSIIRSEHLPPADPWLSGYSISYYYLGYLIVAILTGLSGVTSGVAFNLTIATLFALTLTGAFSFGFNLVAGRREPPSEAQTGGRLPALGRAPWLVGALTSACVVFVGNWEGFLELLHAHSVGTLAFWQAIGIHDLSHPYASLAWNPLDRQDNWWWFRAARVIGTYSPDGKSLDYTINEFPFFSFLLGDMHPHVLALPFAFLVLSCALNALRGSAISYDWLSATPRTPGWLAWVRSSRLLSFIVDYLVLYPAELIQREPLKAILTAVVFGALGFLNAWDLPTYLFVFVGAFGISRFIARPRLDATWWRQVLSFGWLTLFGGLLLYLPFYVGFRSQTSGLGVVGYHSQAHHFLIFWGPLLLVVAAFLLVQLRRASLPERRDAVVLPSSRRDGLTTAWIAVGAVALFFVIIDLPAVASVVPFYIEAPVLAIVLPLGLAAIALLKRFATGTLSQRGHAPLTDGAKVQRKAPADSRADQTPVGLVPEHVFVIFLAFTGLLLLFGTELVFIRDLFNNRMNTVFKLYYQVWVLLAVVAAYGLQYLGALWPREAGRTMARVGAGGFALLVALGFAGALVYAPAATLSRLDSGSPAPTLDGAAFLGRTSPADYAGIQWLARNAVGQPIIVESSGGSYSQAGRVSWNTGLPTLLGWEFHEAQWRGSSDEQRRRAADVDSIYKSTDRVAVQALLKLYNVTYVYVGSLEQEKYGRADQAGLDKFATFLDRVYQENGVTIYRTRS